MALFWCILAEFWVAGKVPESLMYIFDAVNGVTLVFLLVFGIRAMVRTGQIHAERATPAGRGASVESVSTPIPRWTWL